MDQSPYLMQNLSDSRLADLRRSVAPRTTTPLRRHRVLAITRPLARLLAH